MMNTPRSSLAAREPRSPLPATSPRRAHKAAR